MSTSDRWSTPSSTGDIPTGPRCARQTRPAFARRGTRSSGCWAETVERARRLGPELLHESVDGEWSFIETLRHLRVRHRLLDQTGDPRRSVAVGSLDLPWDEMPDTPGVPRDRNARPSLDMVLELRRDRMATVREVVDGLTDESLDGRHRAGRRPGLAGAAQLPGA
ncbi:MAG: DinB family protein [Nocardioidaceae bacterium]